jgi:hypothetical protein
VLNLSRTSVRRALAGLVAVAVVPALTVPAHAASTAVEDARGDMWTLNQDPESDAAFDKAPGAREGDFVRTSYTHTDRRVVVTAKFRDLAKVGGQLYYSTRMRDQDGKKHIVNVIATRANRAGRATLTTYGGDRVDCNVVHRIDYAENKIRVSLPRTCVDTPRRLEFTSAIYRAVGGTWYLDNPHNERAVPRGWTSGVRAG